MHQKVIRILRASFPVWQSVSATHAKRPKEILFNCAASSFGKTIPSSSCPKWKSSGCQSCNRTGHAKFASWSKIRKFTTCCSQKGEPVRSERLAFFSHVGAQQGKTVSYPPPKLETILWVCRNWAGIRLRFWKFFTYILHCARDRFRRIIFVVVRKKPPPHPFTLEFRSNSSFSPTLLLLSFFSSSTYHKNAGLLFNSYSTSLSL